MIDRKITMEDINAFREYLQREEKSAVTIEKYLRDTRAFLRENS